MPWTAIHGASELGDVSLCHQLLESSSSIDVNAVNEGDGYQPLHLASMHGFVEIVTLLLQNGAFPNGRSLYQQTPLHCACTCGRPTSTEICHVLLQAGADMNATDKRGDSCLHHAVRSGNRQVLFLLIRAGADLRSKNQDGATAVDVCTSSDLTDDLSRILSNICQRDSLSCWSPLVHSQTPFSFQLLIKIFLLSTIQKYKIKGIPLPDPSIILLICEYFSEIYRSDKSLHELKPLWTLLSDIEKQRRHEVDVLPLSGIQINMTKAIEYPSPVTPDPSTTPICVQCSIL